MRLEHIQSQNDDGSTIRIISVNEAIGILSEKEGEYDSVTVSEVLSLWRDTKLHRSRDKN